MQSTITTTSDSQGRLKTSDARSYLGHRAAFARLTRSRQIFVEAHALGEIEGMLERVGFKGCSVFAGVEGTGSHGTWRQTGVGEAGMRLVITIGSEASAQAALAWLSDYFKSYPGVVATSEVKVLRPERF